MTAAIRWIISNEMKNWNGPQVINLSVTALAVDPQLDAAIADAISAGLVVVGAVPDNRASDPDSGLDPCNGATAVSPAHNLAAIIVGGSGYITYPSESYHVDNVPWSWDIGSCITMFAPGVSISSPTNVDDTTIASGVSGTSYAAPVVSGVAALYLQTHAHSGQSAVKAALVSGALSGELYRGVLSDGLPASMNSSNSNANGAPNLLVHAPLPTGTDNAVGGVTAGSWLQPVKKAIGAIMTLLFNN